MEGSPYIGSENPGVYIFDIMERSQYIGVLLNENPAVYICEIMEGRPDISVLQSGNPCVCVSVTSWRDVRTLVY